jgi:hypothetical protein
MLLAVEDFAHRHQGWLPGLLLCRQCRVRGRSFGTLLRPPRGARAVTNILGRRPKPVREASANSAPPPGELVLLPGTRWLLCAFSLLTALAFVVLFVLSASTEQHFAWTIQPPVTAAFLGAAYAVGCVLESCPCGSAPGRPCASRM